MTDLVTLSVGTALAGAVFIHAAEAWLSHGGAQCAARVVGVVLWVLCLASIAVAFGKAATS